MVRKLFYCVLVLAMAGSAYAQTNQWLGLLDRDWTNGDNWSLGVAPNAGNSGNTQIDGGTPNSALISAGQNGFTALNDTWGPEWGGNLDIEGGTYSGQAFIGLNAEQGDVANPSAINLGRNGTGGSISIINFLIGDSWWWHGGMQVSFNQWSGSATASDYIWLGGKMNLYGGTTTATNGINIAVDSETSAQCTVTLYGDDVAGVYGKLDIPLSYDTNGTIDSWIANGFLAAAPEGGGTPGAWTINRDYTSDPGRVVLSAVPVPEPATITLLCIGGLFGGLALIRRKHI